ncbi:MAG TPA: hypothetical protein VHJ20_21510 [Polyangia bacterium]|nr:hypothetical protein [Polyangia bacterium]
MATALLAPVLVMAVAAFGFIGQRCRMSGMVSVDTCCPAADSDPPAQSSVGEPGCCERVVVATATPAADVVAVVDDAVAPVAIDLPPVVISPPPAARALEPRAPLRVSKPPLPLLKRSLLI